MKSKKIISGLLTMILICSACFPVFAANTKNNEKSIIQVNDIYEEIYENCLLQDFKTINDDYSSYSYILHHKDQFAVTNSGIKILAEIDLTLDEIMYLESFIAKINMLIELEAIVLNEDMKMVYKPAPAIESYPQPCEMVIEIMNDTRKHANELRSVYDNAPFSTKHLVAGLYFAERVQSGGIWDFKAQLGTKVQYYVSDLQTTMTGENIGNFHYGYVGSACFGPTMLKSMAGMYQLVSNTSSLRYFDSYFDDPNDQYDIQKGINKYNSEN